MKIIKRGKILPCTCALCGTVFQPKWMNLQKSSRLAREAVDCPMCKKPITFNLIKEQPMEKQIEEMAKDLDTCPYIAESIGADKHEGSTRIAQYFYEKGYRKQSEGCDFCEAGNEKCGTCVKFFDYYEDGGSDRCSIEYGNEKCSYYKPVHYCSGCGAKMQRKEDEGK